MVGDVGEGQWTGTQTGDRVGVKVGVEQCVETIHDAAVAHRETEFDHLSRVEVRTQLCEELIGDRRHARTGLRETHDGCLSGAVHAFGKWVVAEVSDLLVRKPDVSTETYVSWYSIVAIVRDRGSQIRQLSLVGSNVRGRSALRTQVKERLEQVRMIRQRAQHVDVTA